MTSRELTSDFDFWSRDHFRMAVIHLPIKFGADIFIQSEVIDIFPKLKMALIRHLENREIDISHSQRKIIRFGLNLVHKCGRPPF